MPAQPRLLGRAPRNVAGVALVLNGDRVRSRMPARGNQLSSLRMLPFARALTRRDLGIASLRLRYRFRGWNAPDEDPVHDAEWALTEIQRRFGDVPVVLVGHSMGGRVALRVGGADHVVGVIALAPWCEPEDPVEQLKGQDVLIAHGTRDRITAPAKSLAFAQRARAAGALVRRLEVEGDMHAMLRRRRFWRELASAYVLRRLAHPVDPSADALDTNQGGSLTDSLRVRV